MLSGSEKKIIIQLSKMDWKEEKHSRKISWETSEKMWFKPVPLQKKWQSVENYWGRG